MEAINRPKIESVQMLRGLAALFVTIFHYTGSYLAVNHISKPNYFTFGSTMVDLFFIISGFIMYLSTNSKQPNFSAVRNFIINRLIRIWPLYIFATWLTVGGVFFTNFGLKSILFYPFKVPDYPILSQAWTLSFEIYFYLVFGLLLFTKNRLLYLTIYFVFTVIYLPHIFHLENNNFFTLITSAKNLYFVIGAIIGYIFLRWGTLSKKIALVILVVGLSSYIWIIFDGLFFNGDLWRYPRIMIIFTLVFIGTLYFCRYIHVNKYLVMFGNLSYSFYLWQYFSIGQASRLTGNLTILTICLGLAINFFVSYYSYLYIEQKLANYIKDRIFC